MNSAIFTDATSAVTTMRPVAMRRVRPQVEPTVRPRAASSRSPSTGAGGPGLDQHVAQRGRLDRTGQHRPPGQVGRQLAEQRVLATRRRRRGPPRPCVPAEPLGLVERRGVRRRPATRGCSGRPRPASLGAGCPEARQAAPDPVGMSPGAMNRASSTSIAGPPAVEPRPPRRAARRGRRLRRRSRQVRSDSWQQPEPADVAQEADAAVDAALVGEVRRPARLGEHRLVELDARPATRCPRRRRRSPRSVAGTPTTADAVSCEPTATTVRRPRSARSARRPRRSACPTSRRARPAAGTGRPAGPSASSSVGRERPGARVEQPGGRGVGDLGALLPVSQ